MNKKLVIWGVALVLFCGLGFAWLSADTVKAPKREAQLAAANNNIPTAAGTPKQSAKAAPKTMEQSIQTKTAPGANVPVSPVVAQNAKIEEKTGDAPSMSPEEAVKIRQELKDAVEKNFIGKVSFPLDEAKMLAYAQASDRVRKINNKWDVQISGADQDKVAIEYNNLAVEEITHTLKSMQGLTLDQYNEMTKLTATDPQFNGIYQAYKQMLAEKLIPMTPATATAPVVTTPVATTPAVTTTPAAASVNPGTVPAPQGSPKPPYSQQPSR